MATIDDKVVAMSFEHSKFESGVNKTVSSLDKLKAALNFPNAGKGLQNIDASAKKVNLGHIGKSIDDIKAKLGFLSVAALAAFATIATKAVTAGSRLVKAFTLDPIKAGFSEYTTNLNAVQTILANTQAAGVGLKDVNKALLELNEYSDKTIYNFSQMAKNIGTFTAAGVDLDTSTQAIKGIANLAALSGSNAEQASTAMYQLSQAIAAGRVSLMDWNSVVNAGMGGTVFQRALANTAQEMGTLKDGAVKLVGPMKNVKISGESFRQSMQAGPGKQSWLTSDVLTTTLKQFTGDLKDAELAAMGFDAAQIKAIQRTAQTAMKAATEVKTLEGVLTTAKETAASGWAQTWQIIFGDFVEAKTLFTAISGAINGFISASADARNKVLGDWKALGGRTLLIKSIATMFKNLGMVLKPIKEAFRDIFPAKTGKDLMALTVQFSQFVKTLKPSPETIENLKRTFRGFFAILSIGKQIIGGILGVFASLFGEIGKGRGSFLNFTGTIGDFLVSVDAALKKGDRLNKFFAGISSILKAPIELLGILGTALSNLFGGFSSGGLSGEMSEMSKSSILFQKAVEGISKAWDKFLDSIGEVGEILKPILDAWIETLASLGPAIGQAAANMNFDAILQVIRTGLFAGIFLMMKNFFGKGSFVNQLLGLTGQGGGILANISGMFGALQGSMVAMQNNIKAKTLKEIAIAVALLAASVVALSFVNPERLKSALTAMTVAFGQLLGAMAILTMVTKSVGFLKLPFITTSLILFAAAIDLLTIAVVALSLLSWESLLKGLGGVAVLLAGISIAVIPLSANSAGMIRAGIGITGIAVGLNLLALAVRQMGSMDLASLAKGLGGIAASLGILIVAVTKMPTRHILIAGAGLIALGAGLNLIALAVRSFSTMNVRELATGLAGIGISLGIIALAMKIMPGGPAMILSAGGLLIVALALQGIARAVENMGQMTVKEMAKGLITLAGALGILAIALYAMSGTVAGAASLGIAAAGLALLAPALVMLGKQSWGQILKGLVTLAAALTILGIAGLVITPVIPSLLGLGVALVLIGGGLALAGAGIALIGIGLSALVVAGPTAVGIFIAALTELQQAIPRIIKDTLLGLLEIVEAFAAIAPKFVDSLVKILITIIDAFVKVLPKMTTAINAIIKVILQVLDENQAAIIAAGFKLIMDLLKGIRDNIGQIVTVVVDIVVKFLNSLANNIGKIVDAGVKILVALLKGLASGYAKVTAAAISIVTKFLTAIANNLSKVAAAGLSILTKLLTAISNNVGKIVKAGTDVIVNFVKGIGNAGSRIVTAATTAMIKFINALSKNSVRLADEGAKAIIAFLNGVADVIEKREPEMIRAGARIGVAIVKGLVQGLADLGGQVAGAAKRLGKKAISSLGNAAKVWSPSRETYLIGQYLVQGLANGLTDDEKAISASNALGNSVVNAFNTFFQITSPSKVMYNIGKLVGGGFAQGLRGSTEDINNAFAELNTKLTEEMRATRETIATEQAKLRELRKEKGKERDIAAIRAATNAIAENKAVLERLVNGHKFLNKALDDEHKQLNGLVTKYGEITKKLEDAQKVLDDAIQKRDSFQTSLTDQYGALPGIVTTDKDGKPISPADQVANYTKALQDKAAAIAAYHSTLEQLRALGLDDATYSKLLSEGPDQQAFASALLSGGQAAVDQVNKFDGDIAAQATNLAHSASKNLYQAGVDMAQGLVNGLISEKANIEKQMGVLVKLIIKAIKKSLKIKSPSAEFAQIGQLSMEGLALGFSNSSKVVVKAVDEAAQDALTAMKKSMSNISSIVTDELNPNPIITPILDLTQVQMEKDKLASILATDTMNARVSLGQASAISSEQSARQYEEIAAALGGSTVNFEQHNYSPEALSAIEIYRQTRNQLSQLKSVVAPT